jgi:ribosome-binding factor A
MRSKKPYHKRKPSRQQIEQLCSEAWAEDGMDPRTAKPQATSRMGRKALQLCSQVKHALEGALAAECGDPLLQELSVIDVQPAPNSVRLLVLLGLPAESAADQVMTHLIRAAGKLRCEVASAITRKKVPELAFCVVAPQSP